MVKIINRYQSEQNLLAEKIVNRIMRYAPPEFITGLEAIELLDRDLRDNSFSSYNHANRRIELYVGDIIGWQPWILRKSYIYLYLFIGIALGHEIDHHVNRDTILSNYDREKSAENNALKYIYPSFGAFRPLVKLFSLIGFFFHPKVRNRS
jgi:hypothetical protein